MTAPTLPTDQAYDPIGNLTMACIDPDHPCSVYGTDLVPWIDDVITSHRGQNARIAVLEARVREVEADNDRLRALPEWVVAKLKTLGDYYEPPKDGRDVTGEIQGWMHVLCFHYVQNRREVKEYDAARRTAKQAESDLDAARATIGELVGALRKYGQHRDQCNGFPATTQEQVDKNCDCGLSALVARHQAQQ